jgi:DNA-binding response OmpR family regulator
MARILIAEDDEDLRLLLRLVVQRAGHEVEGVGDGVAALRAISRGGYDLVVLDNMMPGMTGLEVLRADDFLAKPFSREELVERIHLLLDERAMQFAMSPPGTAGGVA